MLDDVDVRGCLITLDALHTTYETERALVDIHGADSLFTVKGNCSDTAAALAALDWTAPQGCVITAHRPRRATGAWTGANSTPSPCPGGC